MMRHLDGTAAILRDLPNVVDALEHLAASRLDAALVSETVGNEIYVAVGGVHGPEIVAFVIAVGKMFEFPALDLHHPEIGGVTAAIVLAPPHHGMAIEGQLGAVGRIGTPVAPVGRDRMLQAALDRDLIEIRNTRIQQPARRLKQNLFAAGGPADNQIRRGVKSELLGRAAFGGDDKDVVVTVTVGGEGNPLSVRRESWIDIASLVHGEPLRIAAVFV